MAIYAISITYTVEADDGADASGAAQRIGAYVQQEGMAKEYTIVDVEFLEDDAIEELDFNEDYSGDDE